MPDIAGSLGIPNALLFVAASIVTGVAGWRLAAAADDFAARTGLGQAVTGALVLGAITSLPEGSITVSAASQGHPDLAAGNAIGGIVAQSAFLAFADVAFRRANLSHAAASMPNVLQATLLIVLLAIIAAAAAAPSVTVLGVHPASAVLLVAYAYGVRRVYAVHAQPMWRPVRTPTTRAGTPAAPQRPASVARLAARLVALGAVVGLAGWLVSHSGALLAERTGLSETAVGAFFTAIATSLPELATSVAAVRQGALALAIGNVLGGNAFDAVLMGAADAFYRSGSIFHAVSRDVALLVAVATLQSALLAAGFVLRERRSLGRVGYDNLAVLALYLGTVALLFGL